MTGKPFGKVVPGNAGGGGDRVTAAEHPAHARARSSAAALMVR
jgi:hypothetical protein